MGSWPEPHGYQLGCIGPINLDQDCLSEQPRVCGLDKMDQLQIVIRGTIASIRCRPGLLLQVQHEGPFAQLRAELLQLVRGTLEDERPRHLLVRRGQKDQHRSSKLQALFSWIPWRRHRVDLGPREEGPICGFVH